MLPEMGRVSVVMPLGLVAIGCGRVGFAPLAGDGAPGSVDAGAQVDALERPACGPLETPGPYTTDFAQGVPSWASIYQTAPAQMDVDTGSLRGRPGVTAGTVYAGLELPVGDYRARRVFVELPTMLNTAGCAQASFVIQDDDVVDEFVEIAQSCGMIELSRWSGATQTQVANLPYDPVAHRWWQLRMQGGMLHGEASPDGLAWTELGALTVPAYFDDVYVELSAGTYALETAPIGEVRFDELTDCLLTTTAVAAAGGAGETEGQP